MITGFDTIKIGLQCFDLTMADLRHKSRILPLVEARMAIAMVLRYRFGWSYPKIGFVFRRHHSCVIHYDRTAWGRIDVMEMVQVLNNAIDKRENLTHKGRADLVEVE